MRYIIILLISVIFLFMSVSMAYDLLNVSYTDLNPRNIREVISSVILLVTSAVVYPCLCGVVVSAAKIKDKIKDLAEKNKK